MTKRHDRSGTVVAGHWRGNTWIEEHDRRGTTVGEYETPTHDWLIHDSGHTLIHATTCWWCADPVFFYRDENGGCVLFDSLGAPWKVHACWEDHMNRKEIFSDVASELEKLGYDGTFYEIDGEKVTRPEGDELQVSLSGFVLDNYYFYEKVEYEFVRSHKRASTVKLIILEVFDGNKEYPFLMPEKNASEYPVYSMVDINGTWLRNNNEWYLLATSIKVESPIIENSNFIDLLTTNGVCCSCGRDMNADASWGLDSDGLLECSYCGEMRGQQTRNDFFKNILLIIEYLTYSATKKPKERIHIGDYTDDDVSTQRHNIEEKNDKSLKVKDIETETESHGMELEQRRVKRRIQPQSKGNEAEIEKMKKIVQNKSYPNVDPQMRYEMIEKLAYYRGKERNFEAGHEQADWHACEKQVDEILKNK